MLKMHNLLNKGFQKRKNAELSFNQIFFMFGRMIILIIVFIAIVFIARKYIITTSDITNTELEIMMRSFMTNKNSVIYFDKEIGRVYPYVIDPTKFDGSYKTESKEAFNLNNTFDFGEKQLILSAKLTLFDTQGKPYVYKGKELNPLYLNEKHYNEWLNMARAKFIGPGGATEKTRSYYVNVNDEGVYKQGIIEISLVMPNS